MCNTVRDMNEERFIQIRRLALSFLADQAKQRKMTYQDIEQKTGIKENNISRMFSGKFSPSLDNFLKVADAIGVTLEQIEKGAIL